MTVGRYIKALPRFFKKIFTGESVFYIKQSSDVWDKQHSLSKWNIKKKSGDWLPHQILLIDMLSSIIKDSLNILDVGCGQGIFFDLLKRKLNDFKYTGLDISRVAIDKFKNNHPELNLFRADAASPPDLKDEYDVIIFNESLYYFDFMKALPKYKRFLVPDGKVLITMYGSWRTRLIWWRLITFLKTLNSVKVEDGANTWIIKTMQYR